jgi:CubicO group peptidase (beta-lactamase class C family)
MFTGLALLAIVALCCTRAAAPQEKLAATADQAMTKTLDAIFQPLAGPKTPGLAVLVREGGKAVFERGFGARDLRTFPPITSRTDFRLASFSKQFTAAAIMLLARDGKLRYDEPLAEIFPKFPAYGRAITVRNLLNHTSGLADYEQLMDEAVASGTHAPWTAENQIHDEEVLRLLESAKHGKFAPGTSWAYSNSGYVLLGLIVARVSGEPFSEFLKQRVFVPLHMDHTLIYKRGKNDVPERAYGYSRSGEHFIDTDQSSTSATLGDGGVYSNLEDLTKWDAALRADALLNAEEIHTATTPAVLAGGAPTRRPADAERNAGAPVSYGFGWFVDSYQGRPRMWHMGDTSGFRTAIERFTRDDLTVIVLCNRTDFDAEKLALQAADAMFAAKH